MPVRDFINSLLLLIRLIAIVRGAAEESAISNSLFAALQMRERERETKEHGRGDGGERRRAEGVPCSASIAALSLRDGQRRDAAGRRS